MKKNVFAMLLAICMLSVSLAGCGSKGITESDVRYAGPMIDNVLAGIKDKNYAEFSRDFGDKVKDAITETSFNSLSDLLANKIGEYQSKNFGQAANTTQDNISYMVVVYKAKYTKESGDVLITMTFGDSNGVKKIEGLTFNSPNLRQQ